MVAYNFRKNFAADISSGRKVMTIRPGLRCHPGDRLQLYTGMRTRYCHKLADAVCTHIMPVTIERKQMSLNGKPLRKGGPWRELFADKDDFAQQDGFADYTALADWLENHYGHLPCSGFVVRWRLARPDEIQAADKTHTKRGVNKTDTGS